MTLPVDTSRGRYYEWQGQKYVSVTTCLSDAIPKPALNRWLIKEMARRAASLRLEIAPMSEQDAIDKLLEKSSDRNSSAMQGSRVHKYAERIAKGENTDGIEEGDDYYVRWFRAFLDDWSPKFLYNEATVFSRTHGYAGTLDAQVEIDGKTYILDIKTGKSVWPEAALQCAAYRYADFVGRPDGREDPLPPSDGGLVLHLRPEGYRLVDIDTGPSVFDTFVSALDIWWWTQIGGKDSIRGEMVKSAR